LLQAILDFEHRLDPSPMLSISLIALAVFLVFLLIGLLVMVYMCHKKYRSVIEKNE